MNFRKIISLGLSALTVATAIASCAPAKDQLDPAITVTSSAALANAQWLDGRLETIPDDVVLGLGSNAAYGIDMSDFESDGYIARAIDGEVLLFGKTEAGLDRAVREYAIAADVGATAELDTVYHEGFRVKKMTIADTDISEFTIVCPDEEIYMPSGNGVTLGNAKYAAQELSRLIAKATGVTLPIVHADTEGPMIKIGYYTEGDLGENGFTYKVEGGNLYINGVGRANGCGYGVLYFLEHECGWDALMFGDSDLQEADHIDIPEGTQKSVDPMFDYFLSWPQLMYQHRFSNADSSVMQLYTGAISHACHGMQNHDWSLLGVTTNQICHTDEVNYTTVFDNILFYVEAQLEAGKEIGTSLTTIDISQADGFGYCKCKTCWAVYNEENKSHAGSVVRFANRLSDDMEGYYPGLVFEIFAYHGSNNPCKTAPNDNIYITFCTDGACHLHPLDGSLCRTESFDQLGQIEPEDGIINNNDYCDWIAGWGEICDNVYVWHYGLDNNFGQYTMYSFFYEDIHHLYNSGIKGFMMEAENVGLGIGRVRMQMLSCLQYHPELTEEEFNVLRDEIMRREYGEGYTYVQDYIALWEATEKNKDCQNCWNYDSLLCLMNYDPFMYAEDAVDMFNLLEQAKKLCETEAQEMRIQRLQLEVCYRECVTKYFAAYDAGDEETIEYLKGRFDIFVEYYLNNGYKFDSYIGGIRLHHPSNWVIQDNLEDAAWIDWLGDRDALTPEGTTQREMPQKYVEYYASPEAK